MSFSAPAALRMQGQAPATHAPFLGECGSENSRYCLFGATQGAPLSHRILGDHAGKGRTKNTKGKDPEGGGRSSKNAEYKFER